MILSDAIKNVNIPTSALENWRYTPIRKVLSEDYTFDEPSLDLAEDPSWFDPKFYNFIFINGFYQKDLSHSGQLNAAFSAKKTLKSDFEANDFFMEISQNYALQEITFIITQAPKRPLRFLFLTSLTKTPHCSLPRLKIEVAQGVAVDFFEEFKTSARVGLNLDLFKVNIAKDAKVRWFSLNLNLTAEGEKNRRLHYLEFHLQDHACLEHVYLSFGQHFFRSQLQVKLNEHASAALRAVNLLTNSSHVDLQTKVLHVRPHSRSEQHYKTVVTDKARSVFRGEIHIEFAATNASAKQKSQHIKLSAESEIDTQPILNIDCNEVQCSHGATVSSLREEDIFYMRSRGISPDQAKILLGRSFLLEPIYALEDSISKTIILDMIKNHDTLLS